MDQNDFKAQFLTPAVVAQALTFARKSEFSIEQAVEKALKFEGVAPAERDDMRLDIELAVEAQLRSEGISKP